MLFSPLNDQTTMLKELFPDLSMFDLMSHCTSWSPNWTDLYFWYLFAYVNRQIQKTYQSNLIPLQCTVPTVSASNCKIVQISSHDQRTESLQLASQPIYTIYNIFDSADVYQVFSWDPVNYLFVNCSQMYFVTWFWTWFWHVYIFNPQFIFWEYVN